MTKARAAGAVALRYVGDGAFIRGIPTTDLDADTIARLGVDSAALIRSGLYEAARPSAADEPSADLERSDR